MTTPEESPKLPVVEEIDLLKIAVEDILDPKHREWWKEFAKTNPLLIREITKRAYFTSQETSLRSTELFEIITGYTAFVVRAMTIALERQHLAEALTEIIPKIDDPPNGDGDGADQPPSAEPSDDRPTDEPFPAQPDL